MTAEAAWPAKLGRKKLPLFSSMPPQTMLERLEVALVAHHLRRR
jgi:hypothetical protein